jgi:hypothetical protein
MGKINKLGFHKNVWKLKKNTKKGKMCGTSKNLLKMCGSSICCFINDRNYRRPRIYG